MYAGTKKQKETPRVKPHVKKGDTVVVLSGRNAGTRGKVLRVLASKGTAIVERVNFRKKHTRPNPQKNQKGGILEREAPVNMAKLQVICPSCGEPSRTGSRRTEDGAVRYCKNCNSEIGK